MISIRDYFGPHKGYTASQVAAAKAMLARVNALLAAFEKATGYGIPVNPVTGTCVSGEQWGGWRTQACPIGAPGSAHKQARAVDVFDPNGKLDAWITDAVLEKFDLYREHPEDTRTWCHLTDRAPGSGRRTFKP